MFHEVTFTGDILLTRNQANDILKHLNRQLKRVRRSNGVLDNVFHHRLKRNMNADLRSRWTVFPIKYRHHSSLGQ
jgi:hypothetical protein